MLATGIVIAKRPLTLHEQLDVWDLWTVETMTVRCCRGVEVRLVDVFWFNSTPLDADLLCTDDVSLALLSPHTTWRWDQNSWHNI